MQILFRHQSSNERIFFMKYNRIILSAVIALVMMLTPLPCFGKTDVLQYTADSSNAEKCGKLAKLRFESIGHF